MYALCRTLCHCYLLLFVILQLLDLCVLMCCSCFFSILCILPLCFVSPIVYSCHFSVFVQVGGNPFPVNKYHIVSYVGDTVNGTWIGDTKCNHIQELHRINC